MRSYSPNDLIAAQRVRHYASRLVADVFSRVDLMISPTNSYTAFPIPPDVVTHGESDAASTSKQMAFAPLANFVGHPSLTVPIGYSGTFLRMARAD